MVDRPARRHLAVLLRRLASGRLTNDDFEAGVPYRSPDPGVTAVERAAWYLYDDFHTHRLVGRQALTAEGRTAVTRCVLFLLGDAHYEWPPEPMMTLGQAALFLATLGVLDSGHRARRRAWWAEFEQAGGRELWPFHRGADLERARRARAHRRRERPPCERGWAVAKYRLAEIYV